MDIFSNGVFALRTSQLGEYLSTVKNFNRKLFGSNSFRYFYTSLLTMCHVELYCVLSATAAARNGTYRTEWPDGRTGGDGENDGVRGRGKKGL